ncbi:MAG: hypothetical protein ACK4UN_13555, partial [Limisphaerales bacterium]
LITGWVVLAVVFARDRKSFFYTGDRLHLYLFVFLFTYLLIRLGVFLMPKAPRGWFAENILLVSLMVAGGVSLLVALLTFKSSFARSKYWPRIVVGAVLFVAECFMLNRVRSGSIMVLDADRNFYGVTRVELREVIDPPEKFKIIQLAHGQITHGIQFATTNDWRNKPVSYYSINSGIGMVFEQHPRRRVAEPQSINVGVLGLGVGTLAAFGREGDRFRFYEINPAVIDYSERPKPLFTYLRDCLAETAMVAGDARLSLQQELNAGHHNAFDILVMDAFSSDSVPVHLLTSEAFELYLRHLRDEDSVLAVNISNRFLDFRDLMVSMARRFGMKVAFVDCTGDPPDRTPSRWCLISRGSLMDSPEFQQISTPYSASREIVWTDDFSNLFQMLKR